MADDITPLPWRRRAACRGEDPELFFSRAESRIKEARAVCGRCPVRAECGAEGFAGDAMLGLAWGVWGGLTADERREMRRDGMRHLRAARRRAAS